jgi:hypothetical protein
MAYKLKPKEPGFQVTREGEFEYQKFLPGQIYEKVPPEEAHKFEQFGQEVKDDGTL